MKWKTAFVLVACAAALVAQTPPVTILEVEAVNGVLYYGDVADPSKLGSSPTTVPRAGRNFLPWVGFADIVAVNGKPAKGVVAFRGTIINLRTTATPGQAAAQAISDVTRSDVEDPYLEIQDADGTPIGTIVSSGLAGGTPPPGAPTAATGSNIAITGGTGAFLGVRGQLAFGRGSSVRQASMAEDPASRRTHGGGSIRLILHLIPMTSLEIVALPTGPAIFHGEDWSPVTADKPARAGERLMMSVSGLGPVKPNLDPGKPFPPYPEGQLHEVNSPVDVTVNGKAAAVVNKYGWPATTNVYRVDFVVPDGTAAGMATLGLSVAWINGPEVKIPVR